MVYKKKHPYSNSMKQYRQMTSVFDIMCRPVHDQDFKGENMEVLNSIIESLKEVLSGKILVVLLVGTGIWFTARLGFVQFREFGSAFKAVFGNIKLKGDKADKNGMSSFQSLATAIAAQVGTGNLAGAATAMVMGGPGAIFLDVGQRHIWHGHHFCRGDSCSKV